MKRAFSLIELLIVIFLIGLVYGVYVNNMKPKNSTKPFNLTALKQKLINEANTTKNIKLICYSDKCNQCKILLKDKNITTKLFGKKPIVFEYQNGYIEEKEFSDNKCFEFNIYSDLSSDRIFFEYDNKYYIINSFDEVGVVFNDFDKAKEDFKPSKYLRF